MDSPFKPKFAEKTKLFCLIEQGETEEVLKLLSIYSSSLTELYASNNWNLLMYVCRFGNLTLFDHLYPLRNKFENSSGYTYVHAACFGNDLALLKVLVDEKKETVNPMSTQTSENTPLRFALRAGYLEIAEFLIARGAYYFDEKTNFSNGMLVIDEKSELHFKTFDNKDISNGFVVRMSEVTPNIAEWVRDRRSRLFNVIVESLREEGGRRKDDGGVKKEEGGRKEEGGGKKEEGGWGGRREEEGRVDMGWCLRAMREEKVRDKVAEFLGVNYK